MRLKLSHDGAVKPVPNPLLFDQFSNLGQCLEHIQNCLNTDPNDGNHSVFLTEKILLI